MGYRYLSRQCGVIGDEPLVDRHAAARAQLFDQGEHGWGDGLPGDPGVPDPRYRLGQGPAVMRAASALLVTTADTAGPPSAR